MLNSDLLSNIVDGTLQLQLGQQQFTSVSTDSREIEAGALFVPLIAARNGHDFLHTAIKKGAIAALWQKEQPLPQGLPDNVQLYFVEDTLAALQQMAQNYRQQVNPIVIAVTGSNGKTTTKDLLFSVFSLQGETYKTQGNYNNHIGLPLTVLSMPQHADI